MTKEEATHKALEEWLIGLVRAGQAEGVEGALMILFWKNRRAEVLAALSEPIADLPARLRELADEIESGSGMSLGRDKQIITGNE